MFICDSYCSTNHSIIPEADGSFKNVILEFRSSFGFVNNSTYTQQKVVHNSKRVKYCNGIPAGKRVWAVGTIRYLFAITYSTHPRKKYFTGSPRMIFTDVKRTRGAPTPIPLKRVDSHYTRMTAAFTRVLALPIFFQTCNDLNVYILENTLNTI